MWRFALRNLLSRPMRSLLSMLGLTVAILGMVGLFSVAEGIDLMVTKTFRTIPGLAVLQPGAPIPLFSRLPRSWADEIAMVDGVHEIDIEVWARAHIIEGRPVFSPPRFLFGTTIARRLRMNYAVYRDHIVAGRFLNEGDVGTYRTVISKIIAEEFKKQVGDTLHVDGQDLEIVGIYSCDSLLLDVNILLDIGQVRKLARMEGPFVSAIYIEPNPGVERTELSERLEDQFRGRKAPATFSPIALMTALETGNYKDVWSNVLILLKESWQRLLAKIGFKFDVEEVAVSPVQTSDSVTKAKPGSAKKKPESGIEVRGSEDWAKEFSKFSADLDIFLLVLTSIGVTIAVLSIVNTMLMSVTERFIEFGILKANGWTNTNVLLLIGFESALLGLSGGIFGSTIGWIATQIVNANWSDRIHLHASPKLLFFGVVFSTILGILGGLYPAIWASRMMPMDAIRRG